MDVRQLLSVFNKAGVSKALLGSFRIIDEYAPEGSMRVESA